MEDHEFKLAALKAGLKHLFDMSHFCICSFDKLCDLANVAPPDNLRKTLAPLHCVDYNQMPKDLRDEIFDRIVDLLCITHDDESMDSVEVMRPKDPIREMSSEALRSR